ncbi:cysteine desulfurase [bacterium]|nr:cysteine desulfurase [bacterium]
MNKIRAQFPVLNQTVNGRPLVYLDNGATTQKPDRVIRRVHDFLSKQYATVHRGVYSLSQEATEYCEAARRSIQKLINAKRSEEVIFTSGTTQSLNIIAACYGRERLTTGDEILITQMEHHANIVPWQQVAIKTGARLVVAPITPEGNLNISEWKARLSTKTKIVAFPHISNVLGTINPVAELVALAKAVGALTVVDGAQGIAHDVVDVQAMDCDIYAFSGHKMYGPTGVGVLYAKYDVLESMPPYQFGGDMIESVSFESTIFAKPPAKFEAGTPPITEIIGLGEAAEFLMNVGFNTLRHHDQALLAYAIPKISTVAGVRLIGTSDQKSGVVSFVMDGVHPHDVGTIADMEGVAIRVGHHCAQPLMGVYQVPATVRASFGIYNNTEDVDRLVTALEKVREYF